MKHLLLIAVLVCAGCVTSAPDVVVDALDHELEDLQLIERELLPLVPEDALAMFGSREQPARTGWAIRLRAFQVRAEALRAWARGEEFDLAEAQKRLLGVSE